jgi:hypothetical protein
MRTQILACRGQMLIWSHKRAQNIRAHVLCQGSITYFNTALFSTSHYPPKMSCFLSAFAGGIGSALLIDKFRKATISRIVDCSWPRLFHLLNCIPEDSSGQLCLHQRQTTGTHLVHQYLLFSPKHSRGTRE